MTIRVSTLKNGEVRQRVMTIRLNTLLVSWYEGVYHKVSVEWKLMKQPMTGLHKRFSGGRNKNTINKKQHPKGCVHRLGNEQKWRNTNEYSKFGE